MFFFVSKTLYLLYFSTDSMAKIVEFLYNRQIPSISSGLVPSNHLKHEREKKYVWILQLDTVLAGIEPGPPAKHYW